MKTITIGQRLALVSLALLGLLSGCDDTSISSLTPSAGTFGTEVTIEGGYLDNPKSVDFGGVQVPQSDIQSISKTKLKVLVPSGAKTGRVHVTTPNGTGTSPYDFTVASKEYPEQEQNGTLQTANPVALNDRILGSLSSSDTDWFKIRSGPAGVWGYTLEFSAQASAMPTGFELRIDLCSDSQPGGGELTPNSGKQTAVWVALPPNTDIYLMVSSVGSGTWEGNASYEINISRIPIDDKNEVNDSEQQAKPISMSGGNGSDNGSYLCNVFDPAAGYQDIGFKDYYRIPEPLSGQTVYVVVYADLEGQNNVLFLEFISEDFASVASVLGGASLVYKVPDGYDGLGSWYILVSNSWHHDRAYDIGPAPSSCKKPYRIAVMIK